MSDDDIDEIALTDRDLVSLYMKYPEMSLAFDDELYQDHGNENTDGSSEIYSSPTSSSASKSTTQTTPLHPSEPEPPQNPSTDNEQYLVLLSLLQTADLPYHTHTYYATLGNRILRVGGLLFPTTGSTSGLDKVTEICDHCRILVSSLQFSTSKVDEQLATLQFVTSLAPFNVTPQPQDLWTNFRQMAELLIK